MSEPVSDAIYVIEKINFSDNVFTLHVMHDTFHKKLIFNLLDYVTKYEGNMYLIQLVLQHLSEFFFLGVNEYDLNHKYKYIINIVIQNRKTQYLTIEIYKKIQKSFRLKVECLFALFDSSTIITNREFVEKKGIRPLDIYNIYFENNVMFVKLKDTRLFKCDLDTVIIPKSNYFITRKTLFNVLNEISQSSNKQQFKNNQNVLYKSILFPTIDELVANFVVESEFKPEYGSVVREQVVCRCVLENDKLRALALQTSENQLMHMRRKLLFKEIEEKSKPAFTEQKDKELIDLFYDDFIKNPLAGEKYFEDLINSKYPNIIQCYILLNQTDELLVHYGYRVILGNIILITYNYLIIIPTGFTATLNRWGTTEGWIFGISTRGSYNPYELIKQVLDKNPKYFFNINISVSNTDEFKQIYYQLTTPFSHFSGSAAKYEHEQRNTANSILTKVLIYNLNLLTKENYSKELLPNSLFEPDLDPLQKFIKDKENKNKQKSEMIEKLKKNKEKKNIEKVKRRQENNEIERFLLLQQSRK